MVSIDWNALYGWPGYDFWGVILSLVGFSVSIYIAFGARSAAEAAKEGSRKARKSMGLIDSAGQLALIQQMLTEIRLRVENSQWEQVSEKCETIRVTIAGLVQAESVNLSESASEGLVSLQAQMASLQKTSDEVRHKDAEFDMVQIGSVLGHEAESVARAIREIKDYMERG